MHPSQIAIIPNGSIAPKGLCRSCYQVMIRKHETPEQHARRLEQARSYAKPALARRNHLRRLYGIEPATYDKLYTQQEGKCAICHQQPSGKRPLVIDHCHKTGDVRQLLCNNCNLKLGWFEKYEGAVLEYLIGDTAKIVNAA